MIGKSAAVAVLALLLLTGGGMLMSFDEADAITGDYTGSGTPEDPYSGYIEFTRQDSNTPFNKYYLVGTTIKYTSPTTAINPSTISSGFGLEMVGEHSFEGTITKPGNIEYKQGGSSPGEIIYAVECPSGGSGTQDDPYYGSITKTFHELDGCYIMEGTVLIQPTGNPELEKPNPEIDDGHGLSLWGISVVGVAENIGTVQVTSSGVVSSTFHIVEGHPGLRFVSNPVEDGVIEYVA